MTVVLTAFKLGVGSLSGSIGVLSEGVHSLLDLVSAAIAFYTVREAGKDADLEHPFGHGKLETLSSLFEALLLWVAAGLIVAEGIAHYQHPSEVQYQGLAMGTILVSMGVSYWVYLQNREAAEVAESAAIQGNALHFLSDVVASAGVLAGLILMRLTGWLILDPIMAFAVAGYILLISVQQVKKALRELADTRLPEADLARIHGIFGEFLKKMPDRMIEAHDLRTRRSGSARHIDFHLVLCGELTVNESHAVCDEMEERILAEFPRASVTIHVEPCRHENTVCREACPYRNRLAPLGNGGINPSP